jgi:carbon-monoxide dehydrogenase catalytic subunit
MLDIAAARGIETVFSRAASMKPCTVGAEGSCCKLCAMGPCRITGKGKDEKRGLCGATLETIAARNIARSIAGGAAAHSDHGRDVALMLKAIGEGEIEGFSIKDEVKLYKVATYMGIETDGKSILEVARDVGDKALQQFGQQTGELVYIDRAPKKRQQLWRKLNVVPRGIDREIVELMHRTTPGVDQDYESILDASVRAALGDGWGGSMLATDLQDIVFGTPVPVRSSANLGVLKEDHVNILIHGHEPILASVILAGDDRARQVARRCRHQHRWYLLHGE